MDALPLGQWNVLKRLVGASGVAAPGLPWIEAHRWDSRSMPGSSALLRSSPVAISRGLLVDSTQAAGSPEACLNR